MEQTKQAFRRSPVWGRVIIGVIALGAALVVINNAITLAEKIAAWFQK